ncbi:MAG: hypothetical protein V7637_3943 [Mycobacteriales bacterium]
MNPIIRKGMLVVGLAAVLALPACAAYKTASTTTTAGSGDYGAPAAATTPAHAGGKAGSKSGSTGAGAAAPMPRAAAPNALIARSIPKMGTVVTDVNGWTLYRFDLDKSRPPTTNCTGRCAQIWPPALTNGAPELLGVNPTVVGTLRRADGSLQLTLHGWPLYRYTGDRKPGAWKGQNVGGTWFVAAPDGSKNLTCVPAPHPAVSPPAGVPATTSNGGSYGGGTY